MCARGDKVKSVPLIDVNALAPDGTIALDWWYPSEDGRYVAFGTSPNGSELSTLQVIETATGKLLAEKIERTRAASVAWLPDSSGFYYTRYPRPGDVPAGEEMYNRRVFFHQLSSDENADGAHDPLIFPGDGMELAPQHWPNVSISNDGRWLLVEVSEGWTKTELYLKDLSFEDQSFSGPAAVRGRFQRDHHRQKLSLSRSKCWMGSSTSQPMKTRRVSASSKPRALRLSAQIGKKLSQKSTR